MPVPGYGAAPLAKTFVLVRGLQVVSTIVIVGLTANFFSEIVSTNGQPAMEIGDTLTIACIAAFYSLVSLPFFYAQANIGLLVMTAVDFLSLLAFVILSVILGRSVSYLNCPIINDANAAANAQYANEFTEAMASHVNMSGSRWSLMNWAGESRTNCYETKAVWGLGICLAVLFSCSTIILPTLWFKARKVANGGTKSVV